MVIVVGIPLAYVYDPMVYLKKDFFYELRKNSLDNIELDNEIGTAENQYYYCTLKGKH